MPDNYDQEPSCDITGKPAKPGEFDYTKSGTIKRRSGVEKIPFVGFEKLIGVMMFNSMSPDQQALYEPAPDSLNTYRLKGNEPLSEPAHGFELTAEERLKAETDPMPKPVVKD